ncbi:hypothetical protein [Streptomyces sp. BH105]|uniref:hypothetical protein n=1 Tax=Streptomyces sp. BH105 TaxID=3410408 RepID=UPI003CF42EA4
MSSQSVHARIPVAELKGLAGRHVHFVGEFDDPWDIATRRVLLNDWRERYTVFGSSGKTPAENSYFSFSELLDMEIGWPEMAERIEDLSVCVVLSGDMELGLCPTDLDTGWQWSLIEAFTRLGMLPPTDELYLPERMDIRRDPELIRYLMAAFRAGVAYEVQNKQYLASQTERYLAGVEEHVLAG